MTASDARRDEARGNAFFTKHLEDADPEVWDAIEHEAERQQNEIELIASENIVSRAVLEAPARCSPTNTPKAIRAGAITAAASLSTWPRRWRSTAPSSCSAATSPTCSRIPAARPTRRCSWR